MWCSHYTFRCRQFMSKAFFIEVRWDYPLLAEMSKAFLYLEIIHSHKLLQPVT